MTEARQKEVGKFMLSGLLATIVDYTLLNFFVGYVKLPLLLANSLSAPISSYISYKLNKNVVFEDRMHGRKRTLLLYAAILAFGILIIQNAVLHIVSGADSIDSIALAIKPYIDATGIDHISTEIIAINIAKILASLSSAAWNYSMLRHFVFVTQEEAKTQD